MVWKHRSYLLLFSRELEIFGVAPKCRKYTKTEKMVAFVRNCLNGENDFEAILVNFCSYDYNPNVSEAVQVIRHQSYILMPLRQFR